MSTNARTADAPKTTTLKETNELAVRFFESATKLNISETRKAISDARARFGEQGVIDLITAKIPHIYPTRPYAMDVSFDGTIFDVIAGAVPRITTAATLTDKETDLLVLLVRELARSNADFGVVCGIGARHETLPEDGPSYGQQLLLDFIFYSGIKYLSMEDSSHGPERLVRSPGKAASSTA